MRMPGRRIGLTFPGQPYSLQEVLAASREAEARGFDSVWIAEDYWTGRDGLSVLACLALRTERIRLGTAVINPYNRHPVLIAMTFNTLAELAGERLVLGIGAGLPWKPLVEEAMRQGPPLKAMRESIQTFRSLLAGDEVVWGDEPVRLEVRRRCFQGARPPATSRIPVYVGATGPRMTELAGEMGDGLLLGTGTRADEVQSKLMHLGAGMARADRKRSDIETVALIITSANKSGEIHPNTLGYVVKSVSGLDAATAQGLGFDPEITGRVRSHYEHGECSAAFGLLTPAMISTFVAGGSFADCIATLDRFVDAGIDLPLLVPFGGSLEEVLDLGAAFAQTAGR